MRISDWSSDVCSSDLVLAGEDGVAMVGPSAQRTISAGDRPRWHRGSNKGLELSPRTARIMSIVGQTQRRARPIAELHMGMLRHHALPHRHTGGLDPQLQIGMPSGRDRVSQYGLL